MQRAHEFPSPGVSKWSASVNVQTNLEADLLGFASHSCPFVLPEILGSFVLSDLAIPDTFGLQMND